MLLCSWWPLYLLSVPLEVGAHWRRSPAAVAMCVAARRMSCGGFRRFGEGIAEDRNAIPESWAVAASWKFAKFENAEKRHFPPRDDRRMVKNAKIKIGVSLA